MKVGFTCGVFDLFHAGHVLMLSECKDNCDYLIVAVNKAERIDYSINPNKNKPIYSFKERSLILKSIKFVDEVLLYDSEEDLLKIMIDKNINIRFLGDDYKGKKITGSDLNIPVYYTDRSHGLSTSGYRKKIFLTDK